MQRVPPELTSAARRLRRDATPEERLLWNALRPMRPRFTRQLVVDRYIVDFACRQARLIVELDGGQHAVRIEEDVVRASYLEASGWRILRFWNSEVRQSLDGVVSAIRAAVS